MLKIRLTEMERAAIGLRLNGVPFTDTPARRRLDRAWNELQLDKLPKDFTVRLQDARTEWPEGSSELEVSPSCRDDMIEYLSPSQNHPMTGFMGRILGPVYDVLKADADKVKSE